LTRDGTSTEQFRQLARDEVSAYETVAVINGLVTDVAEEGTGFRAFTEDGECIRSRSVVVATGISDSLPDIDNCRRFWGAGVYNCPYCHGYELRGEPLGVLCRTDDHRHLVRLLDNIASDLWVFTDGRTDVAESLGQHGVGTVVSEPIHELAGTDELEHVVLDSEDAVEVRGLFVPGTAEQNNDLVRTLPVTLDEWGTVQSDVRGKTPKDGLYVAGDVSSGLWGQVSKAVADGAVVASAVNEYLTSQT
jgi:thioredoxin reductase